MNKRYNKKQKDEHRLFLTKMREAVPFPGTIWQDMCGNRMQVLFPTNINIASQIDLQDLDVIQIVFRFIEPLSLPGVNKMAVYSVNINEWHGQDLDKVGDAPLQPFVNEQ